MTRTKKRTLTRTEIGTPLGVMRLWSNGQALVAAGLPGQGEHVYETRNAEVGQDAVLASAARQLTEYFEGRRRTFDLPLELEGTPFQRAVWDELLRIPWGETRSYGQVAVTVGRPKASRAVGAANGRNPVAIIVPCHRVCGADGSLTGYGGGLDAKRWLLEHEGRGPGAALAVSRAGR